MFGGGNLPPRSRAADRKSPHLDDEINVDEINVKFQSNNNRSVRPK